MRVAAAAGSERAAGRTSMAQSAAAGAASTASTAVARTQWWHADGPRTSGHGKPRGRLRRSRAQAPWWVAVHAGRATASAPHPGCRTCRASAAPKPRMPQATASTLLVGEVSSDSRSTWGDWAGRGEEGATHEGRWGLGGVLGRAGPGAAGDGAREQGPGRVPPCAPAWCQLGG